MIIHKPTIRLVDASVLNDYEIWFSISSLLFSALIAFLVAYSQNKTNSTLLLAGLVFAFFFIIAIIMAVNKRRQLMKSKEEVTYKASGWRAESKK